MRWSCLVALAACTRAAGPPAPPPAASPPGPAPGALEPTPLAWAWSAEDAEARLRAAGMAPSADALRGYVTDPHPYHAVPGTIAVVHTTEPILDFTPRPGWRGQAHYAAVGGPLDRVSLSAPLTPAAAAVELAALERRLGPPELRAQLPADGPLELRWRRDAVTLEALVDPTGGVRLTYLRAVRP